MNHYSSLPVTSIESSRSLTKISYPKRICRTSMRPKSERIIGIFGQSKLTGAQAQPSWMPILFEKAQVAHFRLKMLQNLLISEDQGQRTRRRRVSGGGRGDYSSWIWGEIRSSCHTKVAHLRSVYRTAGKDGIRVSDKDAGSVLRRISVLTN
jgi:hypothetical protein